MSKTLNKEPAAPKARRTADAQDIAARHLVYKLYDGSREQAGIWQDTWQELRALGEPKAIVDRAVQHGWVTVRQDGQGKGKAHSVSLTVEGRRLAVRSRG